MPAYIGLTGIIGVVVCLILLIIACLKKKSKKKSLIGILIFFVVFIVGVAITPTSTPVSQNKERNSIVSDSSVEVTKKSEQTSTKNETASTTVAKSTATSKSIKNSDTEGIIPDLNTTDIRMNLEVWNIPLKNPSAGEETEDFYYQSSTIDSDTGANLSYFIVSDGAYYTKCVTFSVTNLEAVSKDEFLGVASGYLGFCATVPYSNSEPAKAKKWVEDNIAKCNVAGKIKTLKIGGAEFSLFGNDNGSRILEINPVK